MTFIASVIAKDSIVILADSLTTYSNPAIVWETLLNTYPEKTEFTKAELFQHISLEPAFSQEDGEKMFVLDPQTVITIAGDSKINGKLIKDLIDDFLPQHNADEPTQNKIQRFRDFLTTEAMKQYTITGQSPGNCFIFSCYNNDYSIYEIHDIRLNKVVRDDVATHQNLCTVTNKTAEKMICAGQTRITDKLLWGASLDLKQIVEFTIRTLAYKADNVSPEAINILINEVMALDDIKEYARKQKESFHIRELSTQDAVNFISLLYETVVKFQKYEKRYPAVGGNVKIGILNENGFQYLSNTEIQIPDFIQ